jgi:hypothetical protein
LCKGADDPTSRRGRAAGIRPRMRWSVSSPAADHAEGVADADAGAADHGGLEDHAAVAAMGRDRPEEGAGGKKATHCCYGGQSRYTYVGGVFGTLTYPHLIRPYSGYY